MIESGQNPKEQFNRDEAQKLEFDLLDRGADTRRHGPQKIESEEKGGFESVGDRGPESKRRKRRTIEQSTVDATRETDHQATTSA